MKKKDLKYDPLREGLLKILGALSRNIKQYIFLFISLIGIIILSIYFSKEKIEIAPFQCLGNDNLLVSDYIQNYCSSTEVKEKLESYKNKSISTIEGQISFVYELKNMDSDKKLDTLNSINISDFNNKIIQSKVYKIKGDLMLDKNLFLESIDAYLDANRAYSDNKTFSGLIFYKISQAYFLDFDRNRNLESLKNADSYIKKSSQCEVSNNKILKAIKFLSARIGHEI